MAHDHDHDHHHHHHHDHHDHGHSDEPVHLQIANALINFANDRIAEGHDPLAVAAGMRNASANFSAFAIAGGDSPDDAVEQVADEFHQMLHYYEERHREQLQPKTPLEQLVDRVKDE